MTATPEKELYLEIALQSAQRLFSLLDRTPFSPSRGSWHRAYWHERRSDFSSSACQQGMLATALLYGIEDPRNPYYGRAPLESWIADSMEYLVAQQHSDGSFDEWYPNERGWAGPTGYVIYALAATHALMKERLAAELSARVRSCAESACRFLGRYEELDVLANHQAMALLAIAASRSLLGISDDGSYERLFSRLLSSYSREGWSLEYDGADPGYQTATLSFLARVHQLTNDPRIEPLAARELAFIQFFFLREQSFAGIIGSRSTKNLFHFGFEYWASRIPLAKTLAAQGRRMLAARSALWPGDQDDHYLTYRMPEFLETYRVAPARVDKTVELPCERGDDFQERFAEAGLLCWKKRGEYLVANLAKGGALRVLLSDGSVVEDAGCVVELDDGSLVSSSAITGRAELSVDAGLARTTAPAAALELPLFTTPKLMAFRGVMALTSRTPGAAKWIKGQIRRRIMTRPRSQGEVIFKRRIHHDGDSFVVDDEIESRAPARIRRLWRGGGFIARLVPQSKYFFLDELRSSCEPITAAELLTLRSTGRLRLTRALK